VGRGIEWDAVRALFSREARTPMGREHALTVEPLTDPAAIRSAIELTAQGRRALSTSPPPLDGIPDVREVITHSRTTGAFIDGADLIRMLGVLDAGPRLHAYGREVRSVGPTLASITDTLPRLPALRDALRQALDDDGAVADGASPRLGQLRRDIRERRRRIVSDLEKMLTGADAERVLADRFVTVRHGRYVLPVRAEARGRLRGIVHDRSQSGQTIFVEPERVVESNNALVEAMREEEQEVARILAALTAMVGDNADALTALVETIAELDWVFARAELAERMDATAPVITDERSVAVRAARHPLLLAQSWRDPSRPVVPVDIDMSPERPLLIITGPNAGGKTIVLKTLALLALMAQVGGHVPADEGSRLPVFTAIHALVGDDQSVAENLSTFSAFVRQIRDILETADEHALVLLDELGAGTDPDEGAALAQAILETLEARGCLVLATTHLEPLKTFATTHPGARNASVEFDATTLTPTFRLRYDRPGGSYALTIAARLGLASELILRAEAHRSTQSQRLGELIARLDEVTRDEAEKSRELARRDAETAARLAAAREQEARAQREAKELLDRARRDASTLLTDVRRTVNEERDRLRKADRSRATLDESRRRLAEAHARVQPPPVATPAAARVEDLVPGTAVAADHLGVRGELVAVAGTTATVRAGKVTVRVPVSALHVADHEPAGTASADVVRRSHARPRAADGRGSGATRSTVASEIHLLGQRADEARDAVERYLDQAFLAGLPSVRVVHGKGTGVLRRVVREMLAAHPHVASYRDGEPSEGGAGATVAALKVS
jgi:DNA mismatch repair protein MutS2